MFRHNVPAKGNAFGVDESTVALALVLVLALLDYFKSGWGGEISIGVTMVQTRMSVLRDIDLIKV